MATRVRKKVDAELDEAPEQPVHTVDGLKVVATEPVASNLARSPGRAAVTLRINRLVLEDGSERFACADPDCDFVAEGRGDVQSHRQGKHGTGRSARRSPGISAELQAMSVVELLALADAALSMDETIENLDRGLREWRDRALEIGRAHV